METLDGFALELNLSDHVLSFDIEKDFYHFRLQTAIRNWFVFQINNRHCRCIALPFGWNLSLYYFIKFMRPVVQYVQSTPRARIRSYLDDFLVAARTPGRLSKLKSRLDTLFRSCGPRRKECKGCWEGIRRLGYLGFVIETEKIVFGIITKRTNKISGGTRARYYVKPAGTGGSWKSLCYATSKKSQSLAPWPCLTPDFVNRSLYDSLKSTCKGNRLKLSNAAVRDLRTWRGLRTEKSPSTRPI